MTSHENGHVELINKVQSNSGRLNGLAWSPNGEMLAAASKQHTIEIWERNDDGEFKNRKINSLDKIYSLSWTPDGMHLVTACRNGIIRIWDAKAGTLLQTLNKPSGRPKGYVGLRFPIVSCASRGDLFAEAVNHGSVKVRSHTTGKVVSLFQLPPVRTVYDLKWSPNGVFLAIQFGSTSVGVLRYKNGVLYAFEWINTKAPNIKTSTLSRVQDRGYRLLGIGSEHELNNPWREGNSRSQLALFDFETETHTNLFLKNVQEPKNVSLPCIAWASNSQRMAVGTQDGVILILNPETLDVTGRLEGHTGPIVTIDFSKDGRILASKSTDNTVRLWRTDTWATISVIDEACSGLRTPHSTSLSFHPTSPLFVTLNDTVSTLSVWRVDTERLMTLAPQISTVQYTTAKIVLVGESGVGKTGLGWRLSHGEYKEHSSTHGQQFWVLRDLGETRADGTECEAVLWDFAGQPDYRLIHVLFLDDVDLALILFDPTNRQEPLKGIEYWRKQLTHGREHAPKMILVAARVDRGMPTLLRQDIEGFCQDKGISGGYVGTSALSGEGLDDLLVCMKKQIAWNAMTATVTTGTFKRIKEYILSLKESLDSRNVLVGPGELRRRLETSDSTWSFTDDELMTAVNHLSNHGYVSILRDSSGDKTVLLKPELLVQLASSLVNEARRNVKGLGALDERQVLQNDYEFQELVGLTQQEQTVLLDASLSMFLHRNLCFRESLGTQTLLFFPSLINQKRPLLADTEVVEDVSYVITGAIENVYAVLVVLLGYTNTFTRTHQWKNQAQYEARPGEVCGFRQVEEREGESELILYHGSGTPPHMTMLFQGLIESFLLGRNVTVTRFPPVHCLACDYAQQRTEVVRRIREKRNLLFCGNCGEKIPLSAKEGAVVLNQVEHEKLMLEHVQTQRRTAFETALVAVKGFTRGRIQTPSIFISYAWEGLDVTRWVEKLAAALRNAGVDVTLDQQNNAALGKSVARFIGDNISRCEFILVIGTPRYKEKYENRISSLGSIVAAEVDLISQRLLGTEQMKETVIPLLLQADEITSFPPLLQKRTYGDFRNDEVYFSSLFDLVLTIHKVPFEHPSISDMRASLRLSPISRHLSMAKP